MITKLLQYRSHDNAILMFACLLSITVQLSACGQEDDQEWGSSATALPKPDPIDPLPSVPTPQPPTPSVPPSNIKPLPREPQPDLIDPLPSVPAPPPPTPSVPPSNIVPLPKGSDGGSIISQPVQLKLQKSRSGSKTLLIKVTQIGDAPVNTFLNLDTGSSGLTLRTNKVLPASMLTKNGDIDFRGTSSIEYKGITISNKQHKACFGIGFCDSGYIARANVSFADDRLSITTKPIHFLLFNQMTYSGLAAALPNIGFAAFDNGLLGINALNTPDSTEMASPIPNFHYGQSLHAGFAIDPLGKEWTNCDYDKNECTWGPTLTLGLTEAKKNMYPLVRKLNPWDGKQQYDFVVPNIVIKDSLGKSVSTGAIFDTGQPYISPLGTGLSNNGVARLSIDGQTIWTFEIPAFTRMFSALFPKIGDEAQLISIDFFEENSIFLDFDAGQHGFRNIKSSP